MTAKNRAGLITKLHTALKKQFKPAPASPGRPLLEHLLYASLLEDAPADLADEGFAKCEQEFFDWNEVRVTTVTELAEVLVRLPSPMTAARRLKRNLQSVFETFYSFDIDHLKKENLGKAVAKFEAMPGMTPFVLAYLIQHGLGGHSIPADGASLTLMHYCGIVDRAELEGGRVPGIERAIPKNRAIEFSSLLHQAGVAFAKNPKDKSVWDVLIAVNKDSKRIMDDSIEAKADADEAKRKARVTARRAAAKKQEAAKNMGKTAAATKAGKSAKSPSVSKKAGGLEKPKDAASQETSVAPPASGKAVSEKRSSQTPKVPLADKKLKEQPTAEAKKVSAVKSKAKAAKAEPPASAKKVEKKPVSKKTVTPPAQEKSLPPKKASTSAKKSAASSSVGKKISKRKPR